MTDAPAPTEIEIKLALPAALAAQPEALVALLAATPVLARRKSRRQPVFSTYYDTPDQALRGQRTALRLRRVGPPEAAQWVQTLKTAGRSDSALSERGEWEMPVAGAALELGLLQASPWRDLDAQGALSARLAPCFSTEFERTTWTVALPGGARIEVALDLGHISADGRQAPIAELELELLAGAPAALFTLAHRLARTLPLLPLAASKAERGFTLHRQAGATVRMARPPALTRQLPLAQVAHQVLAEAFGQFAANLHALQSAEDAALVHQARVGWRRLQSLHRLLHPGLPGPELPGQRARKPLRPLLRALGLLRDLDVARMQTLPPLARAYTQRDPAREAAWQALQQALDQAAHRTLGAVREALLQPTVGQALLTWVHWTESLGHPGLSPAPVDPSAAASLAGGKPTRHWLRERLGQLTHRLDAALQVPDHPDALHQARILAKRVRYCTETLAPLLPEAQRMHAARALRWQEHLGSARDIHRAAELAVQVGADTGLAEFLRGVAIGQRAAPRTP